MQIEKCIFIKQADSSSVTFADFRTFEYRNIVQRGKKELFNQLCDSTQGSEANQGGKDLRRSLVQPPAIKPKYLGFLSQSSPTLRIPARKNPPLVFMESLKDGKEP